MKTGATCSDNRPCAATIGFFDGVHRGHAYLIRQVREAASARGLAAAVVTFPCHPRQVVQPDFRPQLLTTCEEKERLLARAGIDRCLMMDFTPELAAFTARQFMALLREQYDVQVLLVGHDHRFGRGRSEGLDDYVRHGRELGMEVLLARAYSYEGEAVSSSLIRRLLRLGNVSAAAPLLGYDYFLQGMVVGGHQMGRRLGFPTANLQVNHPDKLVPANGVYAVRVEVAGKAYGGMLGIGSRPTLDNGADRSIEVHLFGFQGNLYGSLLHISFIRRTRDELKFDSVEQLASRLHEDEKEIKKILGNTPLLGDAERQHADM